MSLNIVVADDEPMARMRLRRMLAQIAGNTVVAECQNGRELIAAMQAHDPDLVFTDIEMPGRDGFEAVSHSPGSEGPLIVFTTAHPQYATRAFDVCALDYLVKPIQSERLAECLKRARRALVASAAEDSTQANNPTPANNWQHRFFVADGTKHIFVEASEIDWIEAADYYACLHAGDRSYLVRRTIQSLSETLDPAKFVRVHRSAIVRVDRVKSMVRDGRYGGHVILKDQSQVQVSSSYWRHLISVKAKER